MAKTQQDKELVARYAKALFSSAKAQKALKAAEKDAELLQGLFEESADLRRLVSSPILSRKQQAGGIKAVLEGADVSSLMQAFCRVLAENHRLALLAGVLEAFLALLSEERGEITVQLISAAALLKKQQEAIRKQLEASLGKKLRLQATIDQTILGGLIVKIGSTMIDDSIRSKLERLQAAGKRAASAL